MFTSKSPKMLVEFITAYSAGVEVEHEIESIFIPCIGNRLRSIGFIPRVGDQLSVEHHLSGVTDTDKHTELVVSGRLRVVEVTAILDKDNEKMLKITVIDANTRNEGWVKEYLAY